MQVVDLDGTGQREAGNGVDVHIGLAPDGALFPQGVPVPGPLAGIDVAGVISPPRVKQFDAAVRPDEDGTDGESLKEVFRLQLVVIFLCETVAGLAPQHDVLHFRQHGGNLAHELPTLGRIRAGGGGVDAEVHTDQTLVIGGPGDAELGFFVLFHGRVKGRDRIGGLAFGVAREQIGRDPRERRELFLDVQRRDVEMFRDEDRPVVDEVHGPPLEPHFLRSPELPVDGHRRQGGRGEKQRHEDDHEALPVTVGKTGDPHQKVVGQSRGGKSVHVAPEILRKLRNGLVAVLHPVGGGFPDDGLEGFVDLPLEAVFDGLQLAAEDPLHQLLFVPALDREPQGHDLLKDQPEGKNVRPGIAPVAPQNFRGEITGRAGNPFLFVLFLPLRGDLLRQPPVHHEDFHELAQHDVFGLQVPVHDVPVVGVGDGVADAEKYLQPFPHECLFVEGLDAPDLVVQRQVLQILPERLAVDQLHDQLDPALFIAGEPVDGDDGGVVQLGGHPGLGNEGIDHVVPVFGLLLQGLDGDDPPQILVPGDGNRGVPPLSELLQHGIAGIQRPQGSGQLCAGVRHFVGVVGNIHAADEVLQLLRFPHEGRNDLAQRSRLPPVPFRRGKVNDHSPGEVVVIFRPGSRSLRGNAQLFFLSRRIFFLFLVHDPVLFFKQASGTP